MSPQPCVATSTPRSHAANAAGSATRSSVPTSPVKKMDTPPAASSPYIQPVVSFYNTSASSAVYFSQSVNVSTQAASANLGWPVAASSSRDWTLLPTQTWYALASSVTQAVTVIRCLTQ